MTFYDDADPEDPHAPIMEQWVVYRLRRGGVDVFTTRRWLIFRGSFDPEIGPDHLAESLEVVRRRIPRGLICLHRSPEDDPEIVEVWI